MKLKIHTDNNHVAPIPKMNLSWTSYKPIWIKDHFGYDSKCDRPRGPFHGLRRLYTRAKRIFELVAVLHAAQFLLTVLFQNGRVRSLQCGLPGSTGACWHVCLKDGRCTIGYNSSRTEMAVQCSFDSNRKTKSKTSTIFLGEKNDMYRILYRLQRMETGTALRRR